MTSTPKRLSVSGRLAMLFPPHRRPHPNRIAPKPKTFFYVASALQG